MPRGQPDFGIYTDTPVASGISDPGEAAARLGSINIYDRRGWTVWMDDFEAPASKWEVLASGGGATMVLSTARSWMGLQSAYLYTAAVAGRWSQMTKWLNPIRQGRIGVEFWVNLSTFTPGHLALLMYIYDGTNQSTAELRLDSRERSARIVSGGVDELVASNCFFLNPLTAFIPVKLVVDTDTDMYVRLLIQEREIDLSAWPMAVPAGTTDSVIDARLRLIGGVAGAQYAYVDNFIFTQNEP